MAAGITTAEILAALGVSRSTAVSITREPSPYVEAGGRVSQNVTGSSPISTRPAPGATARRVGGPRNSRASSATTSRRRRTTRRAGPRSSPRRGAGSGTSSRLAQTAAVRRRRFSSATITDNRPIPVPTFLDTTPSALVGDHVEGQPDTAGTVNFEQVTVTPKAKSGRAEVTRELLDSARRRSPTGWCRELSARATRQMTESTMAAVLAAGATAGPAGGATAAAVEGAIRTALGLLPGHAVRPGPGDPPECPRLGGARGGRHAGRAAADPLSRVRADERGRGVCHGLRARGRSPASRLARRGRSTRARRDHRRGPLGRDEFRELDARIPVLREERARARRVQRLGLFRRGRAAGARRDPHHATVAGAASPALARGIGGNGEQSERRSRLGK